MTDAEHAHSRAAPGSADAAGSAGSAVTRDGSCLTGQEHGQPPWLVALVNAAGPGLQLAAAPCERGLIKPEPRAISAVRPGVGAQAHDLCPRLDVNWAIATGPAAQALRHSARHVCRHCCGSFPQIPSHRLQSTCCEGPMPIRIETDMLRGTGACCGGARRDAVRSTRGSRLTRRFCFAIDSSCCKDAESAFGCRPSVNRPGAHRPDQDWQDVADIDREAVAHLGPLALVLGSEEGQHHVPAIGFRPADRALVDADAVQNHVVAERLAKDWLTWKALVALKLSARSCGVTPRLRNS